MPIKVGTQSRIAIVVAFVGLATSLDSVASLATIVVPSFVGSAAIASCLDWASLDWHSYLFGSW